MIFLSYDCNVVQRWNFRTKPINFCLEVIFSHQWDIHLPLICGVAPGMILLLLKCGCHDITGKTDESGIK